MNTSIGKKQTYLLLDMSNLFYRGRHSVKGDADIKLGMSLHIILNSIKKSWYDFDATHTVVCLEGRSWRKDYYDPYKKNRAVLKANLTPREQEEDQLFWETFNEFKNFIAEKTNCTVLQHPRLEADDLIAGFIQNHPNDDHIILSSDKDFYQLLATNVKQYNGISEELHTLDGIFDKNGKLVLDKKTKEPKDAPNPEWLLFEKCMRGDTGDNVFSAYPGVRTKSTKNKIGLIEAFADRDTKGYAWNNLMLQRWTDHNGIEHRVIDDYERNRVLVDLNNQPDDIREIINETIKINAKPKSVTQVGIGMIKFCQSYDMKKIVENMTHYAIPFQARYPQNEQ